MSIKIDKSYINTISEKPSSKLKPINAITFIVALQGVYGVEKVEGAIRWIENARKNYSGMEAFLARFKNAVESREALLLGDDQKYIADIVFRYFNGQIKPVRL